MEVTTTTIKDCYLITPKVYKDSRGFFCETYHQERFNELTGLNPKFVQDNQSESGYGVIRGLHYQTGDWAQAKLIRVVRGKVIDVVVDLRRDSPSYLQHIAVPIDHQSMQQLFVPRGCAHGFVTLTDFSIFAYKCDNFYNQEAEHGIRYNDPSLNIDWQIDPKEQLVSAKDLALPLLEQATY